MRQRKTIKKNNSGRKICYEITETQRRTLREIERLIRGYGYPPTVLEIADSLEVTPPTIYEQINHLMEKGYLERKPGKSRSLAVLRSADSEVRDLIPVPLLGTVAAGAPIFAEENILGEILVEGSHVPDGKYFAVSVAGASRGTANMALGEMNRPWEK